MTEPFVDLEDRRVQQIWSLRFLDVERLNAMFELKERCPSLMLAREVEMWISEYVEMMRVRDSVATQEFQQAKETVAPDRMVEREHLGRLALIDVVVAAVYGADEPELAGVVRESCYKADFKDWIETRLQGWYIERFGYDDNDVEFLTRVREEIYGVEA